MIIMTHVFSGQEEYAKLLDVFIRSAQKHMPKVEIKTVITDPPKLEGLLKLKEADDHHYLTARAFTDLAARVMEQEDIVAVCDVDLMFLKSIKDYPKLFPNTDISVTVREYKSPLNTGIWFYHPTPEGKKFVKTWISHTKHILGRFAQGKRKAVNLATGIDQAALQICIDANQSVRLNKLPCIEWNATQSEWSSISPITRIVHVKSRFRDVVMDKKEMDEKYECIRKYVNMWREYSEQSIHET